MTSAGTAPITLMSEIARLNHDIEGCEHALLVADRLKARGRVIPAHELQEVRDRKATMERELNWLVTTSLRQAGVQTRHQTPRVRKFDLTA